VVADSEKVGHDQRDGERPTVEREEVVGDWWDEVMQPPTSSDRKGCYGLSRAQTQRRGDSEDEDPPPARSMLRSGGRSREAAIPRGDPRRSRREPRRAYPVSCVYHDHDKLPKHAAPVEHGPKKNPGHWMYSSTPSLQMSSKHALGTRKYVVTMGLGTSASQYSTPPATRRGADTDPMHFRWIYLYGYYLVPRT
jgi:hypothetical protein